MQTTGETAAFLLSDACIKSSCISSHELRFERRDLVTQLAFALLAPYKRRHAHQLRSGNTARRKTYFRKTLLLVELHPQQHVLRLEPHRAVLCLASQRLRLL